MYIRLPYLIRIFILTLLGIVFGFIVLSIVQYSVVLLNASYRNPYSVSVEDDSTPEMTKEVKVKEVYKVDPFMFETLINEMEPCNDRRLKMLVYVHTSPANVKKRMAIRETWANPKWLEKFEMVVLFFVGISSDKKAMDMIAMESNMYGDIIQDNYIDSYRNLTLKALSAMKWITMYCAHVPYILKVDDDVLVNIFTIQNAIRRAVHAINVTRKFVLCRKWTRMKVMRNKLSKWYVPRSEFKSDYYPPYCSGSAFVLSSDTIPLLLNVSVGEKFFWVDDYFLTGILARKAGLRLIPFKAEYHLNRAHNIHLKQEDMHSLMFAHLLNPTWMYNVWGLLKTERNIGESKSFYRWISESAVTPTPENRTIRFHLQTIRS